MNKADVVRTVSEKTGVAPDVCDKIIRALEEQAGGVLAAKLKGAGAEQTDMLARISQEAGVPAADCEKVLAATDDVVKSGIADKLGVFKGLFSKS
jgi:hypothetical protein